MVYHCKVYGTGSKQHEENVDSDSLPDVQRLLELSLDKSQALAGGEYSVEIFHDHVLVNRALIFIKEAPQ